ncbi:Shedu immune nuclease family protein [Pseudoduganella ginsengisoli]|uniref:Uncharacterized protein n=1 Tax=Pseudoduganella ginsengisoli TaxID=1462440 RepID=A0A6L6Q5Y5_9BURK|nr:hypothetical protein [Pseudoduganella ginsengisoli]MTW04814.1 hypothetical protein [Pseudoduganella ginsengisoli]
MRAKKAASATACIAANTFHLFNFDSRTLPIWKAELAAFKALISPAAAPNGVDEQTLLDWFGASVERIALLVYALYRIVPTHVARELTIGNFRADYGWADVDPAVDPTVGLIELENCEPSTLFVQKGRTAPYLGNRFLGGFGQLVDWCAFGRTAANADAKISAVLGARHHSAAYVYALVAGDQRFASDALSQMRMQWWHENLKLGQGTVTRTFDKLITDGGQALTILDKAK